MSGLWSAVRYGFSPVYWLTVGGIPVVFIERATGLSLPSGYTAEDASLVIDQSAEVGVESINRDTGEAVSMPLGWKLLDTFTVRSWLRAPSKSMTLTTDLTATATALTVDDTTGWSNGDAAYLGMERITIGTVASGTSITGATRATVGTLAYEHDTSTTGQIITDRPRFWRGREVTLWASPMDASGFVTGATLATDAKMVWRGRLDSGPTRERDGFAFEASSIDRITDRKLAGSVTGVIVGTSAKVAVSSGYTIQVVLRANKNTGASQWSYIFTLTPFSALSDGDLKTNAEIRDLISAAWSTAVSDEGAGADVGSMIWSTKGKSGPMSDVYRPVVTIPAVAAIVSFEVFVYLDGLPVQAPNNLEYPIGWSGGGNIPLPGWESAGNPLQPGGAKEPSIPWLVTMRVDDGSPSDVPAPGRVRIQLSGGTRTFSYKTANASNADVYLGGLTPVDGGAYYPSKLEMMNQSAEVLFGDSGTLPPMMLRCLMSSGNGERSATYDTLSRGQGYGIDEDLIDEGSFTDAPEPLASLQAEVASGGSSFAELFGGALGLFRKAVVSRPDPDDSYAYKLTLVDTAPYGADYATTIADTDLLSHQDDPVQSVKRADSPNALTILRPFGGEKDGEDRFIYADNTRIDADGRRDIEYRIPATDRAALAQIAGPASASHLAADQTAQAAQLIIPPWIDAEVGDIVQLSLTHPGVWTWSTSPGQPGYTGAARVIGRRLRLADSVSLLTVLFDSSITVTALSPSALVVAYNHATAPTTIDVPLKYLKKHFEPALAAAGGNIWVYHYQPGQVETVTQKHEVSAAAESGSVCRLTIATNPSGHTLSLANQSRLTLPTTAGGDIVTYQDGFAHVNDGSTWG